MLKYQLILIVLATASINTTTIFKIASSYISSNLSKTNSCQAVPAGYSIGLEINTFSSLPVSQVALTSASYTYSISSQTFKSYLSPILRVESVNLLGISYNQFTSMKLNPLTSTSNNQISTVFTNGYINFINGNFTNTLITLSSPDYVLQFNAPKIEIKVSSLSRSIGTFNNSTVLGQSCYNFEFTSSCMFLPLTSIFEFTIPELFSNKGAYTINPFSTFDIFACKILLNGNSVPAACTLNGSVLTVSKVFQNDYTNASGTISICDLKTTLANLVQPSVRIFNKSVTTASNLFVSSNINTATSKPVIKIDNKILASNKYNNPLDLKFKLSYQDKLLIPSQFKIKIDFGQIYFSTNTINIEMILLEQPGVVFSPVLPLQNINSSFVYILPSDLKLDIGATLRLYGINNPSFPKLTIGLTIYNDQNIQVTETSYMDLAFNL
jgi:hypothetical protein